MRPPGHRSETVSCLGYCGPAQEVRNAPAMTHGGNGSNERIVLNDDGGEVTDSARRSLSPTGDEVEINGVGHRGIAGTIGMDFVTRTAR